MPNTHTFLLVSVLIPAYNHASYVGAAVGSALVDIGWNGAIRSA
ncbi:MAG: hypothetical protein WA108_03490 [Thiobacillus sp.]|jgi:hypothetical protein